MRQSLPIGKSPHVSGKRLPTERDYLRPDEVNRLIIAAAKRGRNPLRDVVLLRLIYRHGLRAKEARLTLVAIGSGQRRNQDLPRPAGQG